MNMTTEMKETAASDLKKLIGLNLKRLRTEKKLSQAQLAELCEWGQSRIGNYERGSNAIDLPSATTIAGALGVPVVNILMPAGVTPSQTLMNMKETMPDLYTNEESVKAVIKSLRVGIDDQTENTEQPFTTPGSNIITMKMIGSSMESSNPRKNIPNGADVEICIDTDGKNLNGKAVLVRADGFDAPIIKELQIDGPNTYLVPWNDRYDVIKIDSDYEVVGYVTKVSIHFGD